MNDLERFIACMDYKSADRRPNHELGAWPQTRLRWEKENAAAVQNFTWNWFVEEPSLQLDRREYVHVNYDFIPPFDARVLEETDEYEIVRNSKGIISKALKAGTVNGGRMCMDQYLSFPVREPKDFYDIKKRLVAAIPERYPNDLDQQITKWKSRTCPLILGTNCAANGFYWRAREFMGTEALSTAWYEYPDLMHEMMEFYADFIIETSKPVLQKLSVEYFTLNEDFAMKSGPLLSPGIYREFIYPHLKRMVDFFRRHGTRYFAVDSDGDPSLLIPIMMDAGVDVVWPIERAANVSPVAWRKQFGKSLRLWGGVDKREVAKGPEAIKAHLRELIPLIEEGGYIPTLDHTAPPDISWDNFRYYMDAKMALLSGDFSKLDS
ncbi:MAG TPA: uroporphyrinogen decarboxylase family protein [Candidatus Hydrogenedentes bacterium]|nr:uroporphyrinogen decarboxylase family protein [Candidatus Hydrogenedentota bacterium]HOL77964.1 uroporphyrinogen decarboxylase family protein [Candidatus Hydrogenedentota bacterium]HPO85604.1 uroporphyrinogen decarboxylase family protein [Candidatus Hydrogenedentota bacterium]